jgi:hypothetical protein
MIQLAAITELFAGISKSVIHGQRTKKEKTANRSAQLGNKQNLV